jgi:hypothetical protein
MQKYEFYFILFYLYLGKEERVGRWGGGDRDRVKRERGERGRY